MATLIPTKGACLPRMTSGEKRLADRLEDKLDDDYLLWYDVPVGPQQLHPDFIVLHPSRGLLILEVKDFRLSTIVQADKEDWAILDAASMAGVSPRLAGAGSTSDWPCPCSHARQGTQPLCAAMCTGPQSQRLRACRLAPACTSRCATPRWPP